MKKTLIMSVDLGTSFIKCAIFDETSKCYGSFGSKVRDERPEIGTYIQHADSIFDSVLDSIAQAAESLGDLKNDIGAIVFTGQMAGFMGVDKNWGDVTTWSCTLDTRYSPYVDLVTDICGDLILEESGTNCPVTAPKLKWFAADFPEKSKTIVKYVMISGYVLGRLGNLPIEEAIIDRSYLEWTGLADLRGDRWSENICGALDVDIDLLPRIVHSNTICGYLDPKMAKVVGLKSGIPLVAGSGDKPAGCLGAGIVNPGDLIIEAASYGGLSQCVNEIRPDFGARRIDIIPSAIPGEYYNHFYLAGSGVTLDWFASNFLGEGISLGDAFAALEKSVAEIPIGSDGVTAVGMLGGRAMPYSGKMRGTWLGFNWTHRAPHFYRALLESYSFEYAATIERLQALFPELVIPRITVVGGGAKSDLWNQMNADITNLPVTKLYHPSMSQWGATIIGLCAIGEIADMKEKCRKHLEIQKEYLPKRKAHEAYLPYKAKYEHAIGQIDALYKKF